MQDNSKNSIVLKPNLEGGQNNLWHDEISLLLEDIESKKININELAKYSCMDVVDSKIWTKDVITGDKWLELTSIPLSDDNDNETDNLKSNSDTN